MTDVNNSASEGQRHVFIVGAKCIGQYGGFETFIDKLTEQHKDNKNIQYYIVTKVNGDGHMDESKISGVKRIYDNAFLYHNAKVIKIPVSEIGSAQAIVYGQPELLLL